MSARFILSGGEKLSGEFSYAVGMATDPAPSSHIPVGLNFLFRNFESKKDTLLRTYLEIGQCY